MFTNLFRYDMWANTACLHAVHEAREVSQHSVKLLAHIAGAQQVWFARLHSEPVDNSVIWPDWSLAETEALLHQLHPLWCDFVGRCTPILQEEIAYKNSQGTLFTTPIREVLLHVINHGTHHRAQIAQNLRKLGETPVNTDYITFTRNNG